MRKLVRQCTSQCNCKLPDVCLASPEKRKCPRCNGQDDPELVRIVELSDSLARSRSVSHLRCLVIFLAIGPWACALLTCFGPLRYPSEADGLSYSRHWQEEINPRSAVVRRRDRWRRVAFFPGFEKDGEDDEERGGGVGENDGRSVQKDAVSQPEEGRRDRRPTFRSEIAPPCFWILIS